MDYPFNTIKFETFVTAYHKELVTGDFKIDLENYLRRELLPQVTIPFESTAGSLKPSYNEDRYCGENSAVRNLFSFEFCFVYENQVEKVKAELKYLSQKRDFTVRYNKPLYLWTSRRQEIQATHAKQIEKICNAIRTNEVEKVTCPACGMEVGIYNTLTVLEVGCSNMCFAYISHFNAESGAFAHGSFFMKEPDI